jgi:hypothetical protein
LISEFIIQINELRLVYRIVTVTGPAAVVSGGLVEFRVGPAAGRADG